MANWQLAEGVNAFDRDVEIIISATDFRKNSEMLGCTRVLGWHSRLLITHAIRHPLRLLWYGFMALKLRVAFKQPIFRNWAKLLFFDHCIAKVQPSVVQLRIYGALLADCLIDIESIRRVIRIGGVNGFDPTIPGYETLRHIEQHITRQGFDAVLFNSEGTRKAWQFHYGPVNGPSFVVPNGYDSLVFHCVSDKLGKPIDSEKAKNRELRLLTIASIQELKGQKRVVRAIGQLQNKDSFHYICAGTGSPEEMKRLRSEAATQNVHLELTGYVGGQELASLIKSVHYMILPSTSEGYGLAYIESIACGTPVIIPKELPLSQEPSVLNDKNAVFIDGPDEDSIRKCLERLWPSSVAPEEISETVSHLSRDKVGMRYIEIFKQVIDGDT